MKVYVSNYLSHSISIIDYETLETQRQIELKDNIYPHHFCVDQLEQKIFIPSLNNGTLYTDTFVFAFRDSGVDSEEWYENHKNEHNYYRAVWFLDVLTDKGKIKMMLHK